MKVVEHARIVSGVLEREGWQYRKPRTLMEDNAMASADVIESSRKSPALLRHTPRPTATREHESPSTKRKGRKCQAPAGPYARFSSVLTPFKAGTIRPDQADPLTFCVSAHENLLR
jgi:hypothetical protein